MREDLDKVDREQILYGGSSLLALMESIPRVFNEMAGEIANALEVICQNSLDSGAVSADWKTANVTSLFKKRG